MYDSIRGVAGCLEGTRVEIIGEIVEWIDGSSDQPVCWLNGAAGGGKSAIARTVAHLCERSNRLCASFFFFKGAGRRSTITHFISTIAYNMALSIPATRPYIENALQQDHHIVYRSLERQFWKLIVEPIQSVAPPRLPMVVVIDALDECDDRSMIADFISIVGCAFRDHRLPLRFFFTSRVEEHIQSIFAVSPTVGITDCISLHDFNADDDIRTFFLSYFATIYEQKHRLMRGIPLPWPSERDLHTLIENSSGSFIFAFTLVKFVNDGSDLPHRKLHAALQSHSGLDPLYTQVLQSASLGYHSTRIIQTIIAIPEPLSITDLAYLLQIEGGDVIHALQGVQSIIMVPADDKQPIWLFHTSLRDFLTTQSRSHDLFIDLAASHLSVAADCLRVMTAHGDIIYEIKALEYAARRWCNHLLSAIQEEGGSDCLLSQKDAFMNTLMGFVSGAFDPWINSIIWQVESHNITKALDLVLQVSVMHH
jgi:NACHT domain